MYIGKERIVKDVSRDNIILSTVITRKQWNRKTTLMQYLSVFDGVTKQLVLPDTYKITFFVKWVCLHCTIAVFHGH